MDRVSRIRGLGGEVKVSLETQKHARNFTDILDSAKWSGVHWRLFAVFADNYLFDGIMFAVAPLLLYLVAPSSVAPTIFALNLISESIGAVVLGKLSDLYGRMRIFAFSMALEAGSIIGLFLLYKNVPALATFTSLITFSIGGEFGASYAMMAELIPAKHRGKALLLATNFWNLGSVIIAALSLIYAKISTSPSLQARYLLITALGIALGAGLARLTLPESPRWLVLKGRKKEAERVVRLISKYEDEITFSLPKESGVGLREALSRYLFRFIILAVVTLSIYITYEITAFYIPYAPKFSFGEKAVGYVILYSNLGSFLGAFALVPLIDRSRKISATSSLLGGLVTSIFLLIANDLKNADLFYIMLFVNMVFNEWAWASLSVLESELFPTGTRSGVIGLLVALQGISGASIVYFGLKGNATDLFVSVIVLWLLGLIASIVWHKRGIESARLGIEVLERSPR